MLCSPGPHLIPISTATRAGSDTLVFALGHGRDSLAGLRDDPNAAICLMGEEVAFTACGSASVIREQLDAAPRIAALALRVDRVQDHLAEGRTEMLDGARWRRLDPAIAEADAAILTELQALVRE